MKISFNSTIPIYFKSNTRKVRSNADGEIVTNADRRYYDKEFDNLLYENTTSFFRYDLNFAHNSEFKSTGNWVGFRKTISDYFKNVSKVNVYDFASSDGSEAYSLITSLIEELGEKGAEKFFPILAYDIDSTMVEQAKAGKIPCNTDDIQRFNANITHLQKDKYFAFRKEQQGTLPYSFIAKKSLKQKVKFNLADIQSSIRNIEPSNSLVLCRNFWPYLSKEDRNNTILELSKKLDESSLVVIGCFDDSSVTAQFRKCGFESIYPFIYKKTATKSNLF